MNLKGLLNSMLAFMLMLSFIFPQLAMAQEMKESTVVSQNIEAIAGQAIVYNLEDEQVGELLEGTALSVIKQDADKVYIQWGKEQAYLFEDTVKNIVSEEEAIGETNVEEQENFIKIISDEKINVYTDEGQPEIFFVLEPNMAYFVENYSEELYKTTIGNHIGYIEVSSVTPVEIEPEEEEVGDELEIEEGNDELLGENQQGSLETSEKREIVEEENIAEQALMQMTAQPIPFKTSDKYFEPTERLTVYDNSTGSLVFVGYLDPGQSFPRIRDYGDWHEIKYGNGKGYVWKASTKPSTAAGIKNLNSGLKNSATTVKATSILSVYDNSSGALVQFASLNKDVSYPIIDQVGEWYRIDIAGRIGYIYEPATIRDFKSTDKYFEPTERLTVYDNSTGSLVFVGYLDPGQSFPRIRDYGDWHEIKYGNGKGYVWKASTKPSTAAGIKNLNPGVKNSTTTVKATSVLSVYDNSSGALVQFASLNKDVSYPIIDQMGDWYRIDIAGRIGYIYEPATIRDFKSTDKYFEPLEKVAVYDNSEGFLKHVGYLNQGQSYPRIRDYGDWHEIKYGNGTGYVTKKSTKPSTGSSIKNINPGLKNSGTIVKPHSMLSVYDNSSGALVQFATLNKNESYPVIGEYGPDWYKIDVAGRIGYIFRGGINKVTKYNTTLQEMLNKQMSVRPQTDKYRNDKSYVSASSEYIILDDVDKTKGYVQVASLNVRAGVGVTYRIVGTLGKSKGENDFVRILGEKDGWYEIAYGAWKNATEADTLEYLDPNKIKNNSFQYLILSKHANTNVEEVSKELVGKGILEGRSRAQAFINAAKQHNINEVYLIAHAYLETGRGTSKLSQGIVVNGQKVYNMFGIGAVDACPDTCGAQRAYEEKWFTPEAAIIGGAKFVSEKYVYSKYKQDTLYKMRWNPAFPATHQYATDIGWATKQANIMEGIYSKLSTYTIELDIPEYR